MKVGKGERCCYVVAAVLFFYFVDFKLTKALLKKLYSKSMGREWLVWELSPCCLNWKDFLKSRTFWLRNWLPTGNTCPERVLKQECLRWMQIFSYLFCVRKDEKKKMLHGDIIFLQRRKYWLWSLFMGSSVWYQMPFIRVSSFLFPNHSHSLLTLWSYIVSRSPDFRYPQVPQCLLLLLIASINSIKYCIICFSLHSFKLWLLIWNPCKVLLGPFQVTVAAV